MTVQVASNVYWVGATDPDRRHFHGHTFRTPHGTSYNAYLIVDDRVALVDTVLPGCEEQMLRNISEVVDPARIDLLVANHAELDHSGAIPAVLERAPAAQLVCSKAAVQTLGRYLPGEREYHIVRTGEDISLGQTTLSFVEARLLHWPDSMFTYIPEHRLLLPNDAFGQHLGLPARFDDEVDQEVLWRETRTYFAGILWPFSRPMHKKLEELEKLQLRIDTIAPSHGVIWREQTGAVLEAYGRWSSGHAEPRVVVAHETMWGSTTQLAVALAEGLREGGVEVALHQLPRTDATTVLGDLLEARGILLGTGTHNNRALPHVASLADELIGLRPPGKLGAAFGSHGWGGGGVKVLEQRLQEAGIELVQEGLTQTWRPTAEERDGARAFGRAFAERVLAAGPDS